MSRLSLTWGPASLSPDPPPNLMISYSFSFSSSSCFRPFVLPNPTSHIVSTWSSTLVLERSRAGTINLSMDIETGTLWVSGSTVDQWRRNITDINTSITRFTLILYGETQISLHSSSTLRGHGPTLEYILMHITRSPHRPSFSHTYNCSWSH